MLSQSNKKRVRVTLRDGRDIDIPMFMIEEVQLPVIEFTRGRYGGLRFKSETDIMEQIAKMLRKAGFA